MNEAKQPTEDSEIIRKLSVVDNGTKLASSISEAKQLTEDSEVIRKLVVPPEVQMNSHEMVRKPVAPEE